MELCKDELALRAALSHVETPAYDMESEIMSTIHQGAKPRHHRLPRAALLAAALVAALAIGAAAVGISGLWARFFPNPVPQNAVTSIGVSQTSGEYTLTLEDAMVDEDTILLLMSLRRADGKPIAPEAHLETNSMSVDMLADGEPFMGGGGFDNEFISEDGTTRYFSYEIKNYDTSKLDSLLGKKLTFNAEGVAVQIRMPDGSYHYKPTETVDLSPLAEIQTPDFSGLDEHWRRDGDSEEIGDALDAMGIHLLLPLNDEFPLFTVRGAVMTPDGLGVILPQGQARSGNRVCTSADVEALIDTRDGTRYSVDFGTAVKLPDGSYTFLSLFEDCPLTAADLPYLRLEVSYAIDRILSEEPFFLTFTPDSGTSRTVPLTCTVTIADTDIHLTKLHFSALGLSLDMDNGVSATDLFEPDGMGAVVTLKDGSTLQSYRWGGQGSDAGPSTANFRFYDVGDDHVFLDTTQVASVTLNGVTLWAAP